MYFVYIIQSKVDGLYYTGMTENLNRRLKEHHLGKKSTRTTMFRSPFDLVHVEVVNTRSEARNMEKFLKSGFGREIREEISQNR